MRRFSTLEGELKAERMLDAFEQRADMGIPWGPPAFGYVKVGTGKDQRWDIDPDTAALVREAYKDFLAGRTLSAIARDWNDRGVTTGYGNPWTQAALSQLLRAPRYAGLRAYDGEIVGRHSGRPSSRRRRGDGRSRGSPTPGDGPAARVRPPTSGRASSCAASAGQPSGRVNAPATRSRSTGATPRTTWAAQPVPSMTPCPPSSSAGSRNRTRSRTPNPTTGSTPNGATSWPGSATSPPTTPTGSSPGTRCAPGPNGSGRGSRTSNAGCNTPRPAALASLTGTGPDPEDDALRKWADAPLHLRRTALSLLVTAWLLPLTAAADAVPDDAFVLPDEHGRPLIAARWNADVPRASTRPATRPMALPDPLLPFARHAPHVARASPHPDRPGSPGGGDRDDTRASLSREREV